MMKKNGTSTSACGNVNDVAGGRKTMNPVAVAGGEAGTDSGAILVSFGHDDAVVFADEFESVPSLESEDDDDDDVEEEEEESDDEEEDAELNEGLAERLRVLADARSLKILAMAFLHPEKKTFNTYFLLEGTDPAVFGRNYFDRHSAPERLTREEADEEAEVLEDARRLREAAAAYLHPEVGVATAAPENFGRNYFGRYSAPETEDKELADERARVFAEAAALKKSAVDYLHPEVGVTSADGACFGRNYFNRYSAPETGRTTSSRTNARRFWKEAAALKKLAVDYMHPEIGVKSADATLFGRNYFGRYSAPEMEDKELADERARVFADAAALKKLAVDYLHPESRPPTAPASAATASNRYSAPETEDDEFADERAEILEEAAALKKLAVDYMHPEIGVKSADATLFGRNYFGRYSAPETEDKELADERARVFAEAAALKKSAVDYLHPEVGVTSADGACFGRNYFNRYSAPETEDDEFADERAEILEEAAALKKLAVDYMHPEIWGSSLLMQPCSAATALGRYSAPGDGGQRSLPTRRALAAALKLASTTCIPRSESRPPTAPASAATASAATPPPKSRTASSRTNAEILEEAAALKKLAVDYMHPEIGVKSADATLFGRNYFGRYSAPETEDKELADERARVFAEAAALKKLAVDYLHPEVGVTSADGACFGRNYFNRYSAPETEDDEFADERAEILEEAAALKKLAAVVKGANLPSIKSAKSSSSEYDVGATKKSASSVNLFGLSEEVF
ncbi:LOW QUALITY PROTEIN: hypothetical protein ACHAW5_001557 [Stephanodiscus triporus]|uniref:Uncharacterized protein n=1 Tax=Stephanodiscus triporus TaxID=2934178 RepID=A0ABD3NJG6_9STRA